MEFAGNTMVNELLLVAASGCATIAPKFAALYCQTCAAGPGVKFARASVLVRSLPVLLITMAVRFKSERNAPKTERLLRSALVDCTPVSPKVPPIPS
jgi:hypothetical protein